MALAFQGSGEMFLAVFQRLGMDDDEALALLSQARCEEEDCPLPSGYALADFERRTVADGEHTVVLRMCRRCARKVRPELRPENAYSGKVPVIRFDPPPGE